MVLHYPQNGEFQLEEGQLNLARLEFKKVFRKIMNKFSHHLEKTKLFKGTKH